MMSRRLAAAVAALLSASSFSLVSAGIADAASDNITCQRGGAPIDAETCLRLLEQRLRASRTAQGVQARQSVPEAKQETQAIVPRGARRALAAASKQGAGKDDEPKSPLKFLLRRSMDDIESFASPKELPDAAGAEFSWTRNGVSGNHTWAARGIVALPFVWENPDPARNRGYLSAYTLAPYMIFDRVTNTVESTKNVDNLVFGFSGEATYANLWQAAHILRLRSEVVSNFDGGKPKNWAAIGEYMPIGNPEMGGSNSPFAYFGTPLSITKDVYFTVTPKLTSEFRSSMKDELDPIFADSRDVFRSGGKLMGAIAVDNLFSPYFPFYSIVYQASYGWMWDWISERDYRLFETSLTLNLTAVGNVGLTLSYRRGELEETGDAVDETKAGLAVKF